MPRTLRFACDLRHGLHARPASLLAQIASRSRSRVTVRKDDGSAQADARGVLSVIALDIRPGDAWSIDADGPDESAVAAEIEALVHGHFGESEAGEVLEPEFEARVPAAFKRLAVRLFHGQPASSGVGRGRIVSVGSWNLCDGVPERAATSIETERDRATRAIEALAKDFNVRAGRSSGPAAELLRAHGAMVADAEFVGAIQRRIESGSGAERAVAEAVDEFTRKLRGAASVIIRERAADVVDLGMQLIESLGGKSLVEVPRLSERSVVFADNLTPGQFLKFDAKLVAGLVLGEVGLTSHIVILARSMGIPAIVGVANPTAHGTDGRDALIDSGGGLVIVDPAETVLRLYEIDERTAVRRRAHFSPIIARRGAARDGVFLDVGANASSVAEVTRAIANGADGIGLFRTEFLYLDREHAPTEEELFGVFRAAIGAAAGKPIIFRTFDIGADKPALFLRLPPEENPFLGERGIRLYSKHATLLRTQLRAIIRAAEASAPGVVRIMAPMVTRPSEMAWFRGQVRATEKNLGNAGHKGPPLDVGMMLEVPAAAGSIAAFAEHADFFSVGTNDLSQYWFAADRGNPNVHPLASELDPSFIGLLQRCCASAKKCGKWIGLCGEMASDPRSLPFLLGIGLDEISVSAPLVAECKTGLHRLAFTECSELVNRAVAAKDTSAVLDLGVSIKAQASGLSPISEELVDLQCEGRTKEEAIRELAGVLFAAGRTIDPRQIEEDIWAREETYSTGLGFGFAVPHCRTGAVDSVVVSIGRMRQEIDWNSSDGRPVRHVILLAVPKDADAKAHLQVLAKLARRLVHEDFRSSIERALSAREVSDLLKLELGL